MPNTPSANPRRSTGVLALRMLLAGSSVLALGASPVIAMAAEAAPSQPASVQVDEVIVTARRTSERLQDVPIAVTAVDAETLERRQVTNLADIQAFIPNATFYAFGGSNNNASVYIRGVGQADQLFMFDPGVGIYLDDAYIGRAQAALFEMTDPARVEVLRGPQGTLYGKNTSGGALKVVTKDPDLEEASGSVTLTGGDYSLRSLKASGDLPLVNERLGVRASVLAVRRDGFVDNLFDGRDLQDRDFVGGQVTGLARLSDSLTARLAVDAMRDRSKPAAPTPSIATSFPPNLPPFTPQAPLAPRQSNAGQDVRNDQDVWGVNGQLTWDLGAVQLKSITSHRDLEFHQAFDYDSFPYLLLGSTQDQTTRQTSQELQANVEFNPRLKGVFGLYYFKERTKSDIGVPNTFPFLTGGIYIPIANSYTQLTDLETTSTAAYGNLIYEVTDRLSISAGLRYSRDNKQYESSLTNNVFVTSNFAYDLEDDWDAWLPRIGLEYKLSPDRLLYASWGTGFKSGGFNPRAAVSAVAAPYGPEKNSTYEIGYKSSNFGNRLIFNAAAFYNTFKDYQTNLVAIVGTPPAPTAYFANAGDFRSWGAEVEVTARPTRGLTLNWQASYFEDEFKSFTDPLIGNFADKTLPNAPKRTTSLGATYEIPVGDGALEIGGDVAYRGASFTDIRNDPVLRRDAYTIVNARVSYGPNSGRWQVFAGVKNLTDETYLLQGVNYLGSYNFVSKYYSDPRTWTAGVRVNF